MSLLAAREVSKRYGPVVALRSATLVVEPGEVHALLGANGAGKSTLVKVLTGVIKPDGGTLQMNGDEIRVSSPAQAARHAGAASLPTEAVVEALRIIVRTALKHADDLSIGLDAQQ